jgi:RHS repeat-associated protein
MLSALCSESSASYYRARYYDSNVGRFASEDPIGFKSDLNLYRYVRNKPINFRDPSGKNSDECASTGNDAARCRRWQMDCSASAAFVVGVPCYYSCTLIPAATPLLRAAKIGCYLACAAVTTFAYYECMERNAPACSKWR